MKNLLTPNVTLAKSVKAEYERRLSNAFKAAVKEKTVGTFNAERARNRAEADTIALCAEILAAHIAPTPSDEPVDEAAAKE